MKFKRYIRLIVLFFVYPICMHAGVAVGQGDTLKVQFRVGQSNIDLAYADNERQVTQFCQRVWRNLVISEQDEMQLNIYTGASPEGPAELNRRLGEQRGIALKQLLTERLEGLVLHCAVINEGARWGQLYNMVEQSDEPWREEVLTILGKRPEADEWKTDDREQRLRKLKNGIVWRELNERYLPVLRSSGSAVIFPVREIEPHVRDTIVIRDTIIYLPEPCPQYEPPIDLNPAWAIKTNFLLWGVIAPNVQVERSLGKTNRWSIEGEFFMPWWTWSKNAHAEQFFNVGVELRYWLGDRQKHHTLDGWHLGGGLAGGYYDFEWKRSEGWQGEYLNIYCNLGYQHRFGRRNQWAVDGGLALGYIPTKYRHYLGSSVFPVGYEEKYDDHLMWQDSGWKHILGATHVNFSIAYIIGAKKQSATERATVVNGLTLTKEERKAAKAAEKAAKKAEKAAEKQTRAVAKQADEDAKVAAEQVEQQAKAVQAAAKQAEKEAEEQAKAAAKAAKIAEKQAEEQAKAAAKAEKEAEKAAQEAAKQAEQEAKIAAKQAEQEAKIAAKQAEEQAKQAAKEAEEQAKAAAKAEKEAEKAAQEAAKQAEKEAKEAAKQAEKEAKAAEKAARKNAKEEEE